ncbi:hypothetical protein BHM03_00007232 [Ensete ventricosum]|nr:hypothetical protein BHM03_00007232 [Ensete ventricosum]
MAPTFDSAASTLFCAEDNNSVLGLDEEEEGGHGLGWVSEVESSDFYGDFLVDFPVQSDECVGLLVGRETEHMPREDYAMRLRSGALDLAIRRDAIDWIWKSQTVVSCSIGNCYACLKFLFGIGLYWCLQEGVVRCYEMIKDLMAVRGRSLEIASPLVSYVPQSPNGVLDAACLSYKSGDMAAGSQATCHQDSPANKRRKTSSLPIP